MLEKGMNHTSTTTVDSTNIAVTVGSGDLEVFATPAMIALMENAAMLAVAADIEEGNSTVGTIMNVTHNRATPVGEEVSAHAVLQEVDGRKLIYHVSASDSMGIIGEGVHERFVVNVEKFMGKLKR